MVDIPNNSSTTTTLIVGGLSVVGNIEVLGDVDWIRVDLVAGRAYQFFTALGPSSPPLADSILGLRDSAGNLITSNDDYGASGHLSRIGYIAETTGTYYLDVSGYQTNVGLYSVQGIEVSVPPIYTNDQIANQLITAGWSYFGDTAHHFNVTTGGSLSVNISALTTNGQFFAREALKVWSDATGIRFVETTGSAQVTFDDADVDAAYENDVYANGITTSATINIGTSWISGDGTNLNSYSFQTYIHEIGHALGLAHGGNYNVTAQYGVDNLYQNDSWNATVMSYFSQTDASVLGNSFAYVVTPMIADLIAIQNLYGVSTTTNLGNTLYYFDPGAPVSYTAFDSGGVDTFNFTIAETAVRISLIAETYSNIGNFVGIIGIARSTVIENAVGGRFSDTIIGNAAANVLHGGEGDDTIDGGAGDDKIYGGDGLDTIHAGSGNDVVFLSIDFVADVINAGDGIDTLDMSDVVFGAYADLRIGVAQNGGGNTQALNFENLNGSSSNDIFYGNAGQNWLFGGNGSDYLNGGNGADHLWGGFGTDQLIGGDDTAIDYARYDDINYGNLTLRLDFSNLNTGVAAGDIYVGIEGLVGGAGNDLVVGNSLNNSLFGGAGIDLIYGQASDDYLNGGGGGDQMWGGVGADQYFGGSDAGIDYARYDDANWGNLTIRLDAVSQNTGVAAGDTYNGIEGLVGGLGNDLIVGDINANYLFGGSGADYLFGSLGNDYLNGGAGADKFAFNSPLSASTNVDDLADFSHLIDDILLYVSIFSAVGTILDASEFVLGSAAIDANDFIIYNSANGQLFYDANGSGAGGRTLFTRLTVGTMLDVNDFLVA